MTHFSGKQLMIGTLICSIGALFYCYEFILRATPGIMVQDLMGAYHVSAETIGLLSTCYYFLYTPLQLPAGVLMDKYGPRLLLTGSVIFCTIGSLSMYLSMDIIFSSIAQIIIGAGSAFAFVGAMKLAANWIPERHFALFSGITTTLGMIGAVSADTGLLQLLSKIGWQHIWLLLAAIGLLLCGTMYFFVQDGPERSGLAQHRNHKVKREHKTWHDFYRAIKHILINRTFWLNSIVGGILFMPFTVLGSLWGIQFLIDGYHLSHSQAGIGTSMLFLGMAFGGPIAGWLSEKMQDRLILIRLSCLLGCFISACLLYNPLLSYQTVCVLMFIYGFVLGAEVIAFAISTDLVDSKYAGTAVAATNFVIMLWEMFIQPVVGRILDYHWDGEMIHGHALFTFSDYQAALSILPISCFVAYLLSLLIKPHKHRHTIGPPHRSK